MKKNENITKQNQNSNYTSDSGMEYTAFIWISGVCMCSCVVGGEGEKGRYT